MAMHGSYVYSQPNMYIQLYAYKNSLSNKKMQYLSNTS
ncbi:hypothetical protein J616_03605 [Acinetobacter baumannii 1457504]|nr:hypothetical protein J616_03605 [Acinetobacter baumannii 1457504]